MPVAGYARRVLVRRETPADVTAVRAVVAAAFLEEPGVEPVEVRLLDRLRECADWLPPLSLVAVTAEGEIAGHVVCTRGWIGDAEVVGLGPLAVRPDLQRRGVGSALVHAVLAAAEALDVPAVALLGSTVYYARFGFVPGSAVGVESPEPAWGDHFQVRPLVPDAPRGAFRYAAPFRDLE